MAHGKDTTLPPILAPRQTRTYGVARPHCDTADSMPDFEDELSRELTRVISCQYPASLAKLADVVAPCSDRTVRKAILDCSPCAIAKLAAIVSAALPLWSYTLPLLHSLCRSPEFRDELLQQNPGLLDALLAKANVTQHEFGEYADLCVRLLSKPLPSTVALPASAQPFFLRMFEKATQAPDVESLRPIYSMLNGACRNLLSLLPSDARNDFDQELCRILSSNSTGQNSMLLLWCFGIVILAEHPHNDGPLEIQQNHWKSASGRKLFGSANGIYKTINLTYLSVIWAVKGDVGVSDIEAIEGIRIAIRAMQFVNEETRRCWPTSSVLAKNIFPKLPAKLIRKDIPSGIQLEALSFYAMIAGEQKLSSAIVDNFETSLLDGPASQVDADFHSDALSVALPLLSSHLRPAFIATLLKNILHAGTAQKAPRGLAYYTSLVTIITAKLTDCPNLREKFGTVISSSDLQPNLQSFIEFTSQKNKETAGSRDCTSSISLLRQRLVSATLSMLLTCAIFYNPDSPTIPPKVVVALIAKQWELAQPSNVCSHPSTIAQPPVSLFEQQCTPTVGHRQDWRQRLTSEIELQSVYQRDSVIRSVAQICQDLETRCDTVEEPLRIEQARVKELNDEISALRAKVRSLETESLDRRLYIDGLEAEIESLDSQKEDLSKQMAHLQVELKTADQNANENLRTLREELNTKEMEFRSTILTHEQDLDDQRQLLEDRNTTIEVLSGQLQNTIEEKDSINENFSDVQLILSECRRDLDREQEQSKEQAEELRRLHELRTELDERMLIVQNELKTRTQQAEELKVRHQDLQRSSKEARDTLIANHNEEISAMSTKTSEEYAQLNVQLQESLCNAQRANDLYETTHRELQRAQHSSTMLGQKMERLVDSCKDKDEELLELRSLRSRVMASMGLTTNSPLPAPTRQHSTQRDSREQRRRKSGLSGRISGTSSKHSSRASPEAAIKTIGLVNASFSSTEQGSTPKRSKVQASINVPGKESSARQSHISDAPTTPTKSISFAKRPVLKPVSPNRRHTSVGFMLPNVGAHDNADTDGESIRSLEQDSFGTDTAQQESPLTPGNFIAGTVRSPWGEEDFTTEL